MFSNLKIWAIAAGAAIIGILKIMLGLERSKRKQAEQRARIEESNRKDLEKTAKIQSDIEKERRNWDEKITNEHKQKLEDIEKLDDESLNDADFIAKSIELLKRPDNTD